MATTKRENPSTREEREERLPKKFKNASDDSSNSQDNLRVVLNPADCNLDFNIEGDGITGHALYEQGFAYCWSGARANVGITGGKYCFGCKIVSGQPVHMEDTPPDQQNVCRIGISRGDDPVGNLGETEHSYGFGGTGKFSNAGRFLDYGEKFGIGDTILCLVDLESKPCGTIEFSKNGKRLGIAKHFDVGPKGLGVIDSTVGKVPWESALFPHVLLKNTVVEMQFSTEDGLIPEDGYKPWASAVKDGKVVIGPSFSDPADCEVIMMVGLPASGKTTWAEKWVKEHPEKRYVLLGTNLALEQMKVPGLLRKHNYGERFDRLMDRATGIFNTLLSRASKVPRNYILDQTNVYKSARKRKLKPFAFCRKIAVVVFPRQDELKLRAEKRFREMGKEVPPEAVNEMLANFVLPMSKDMHGTAEYFDEIIFPELNRVEAQQHLDEMKRALALTSSVKSKSNHPPYSWESSVHSDSWMSTNSLPGPALAYSGYNSPSVGVQAAPRGSVTGGSWVGPPAPDVQPYPANVHAGYAGPGQLGRLARVQPCPVNVNTGYGGPAQHGRVEPFAGSYQGSLSSVSSRDAYHETYSSFTDSLLKEDFTRYDGYTHDPHRRRDTSCSYGTMKYMNPPGDARAAYQTPGDAPYSYGSMEYMNPPGDARAAYRTPEKAPYSYGTMEYMNSPRDARAAYRTPEDPTYSYGAMEYMNSPGDARAAYRTPGNAPYSYGTMEYDSPYQAANPRPYGSFPANVQHPEGALYGPSPRYY